MDAGLDATSAEGHAEDRATEAQRIREKTHNFAETGHGDVVKLTDVDPPEWRLRVGDWRVFLGSGSAPHQLHVLRVKKRDNAYR